MSRDGGMRSEGNLVPPPRPIRQKGRDNRVLFVYTGFITEGFDMTGYTQELVDRKLNFEGFALLCARAFGACIMLRDEPLSAPIPETLKPSDYHFKAIDKAKKTITKLKAVKNVEVWGRNKLKKDIAAYKERLKEANGGHIARMESVLKSVCAWEPPHADFIEFKKFMLQQLNDSIAMEKRTGVFYEEQIAKLESTNPSAAYKEAVEKAKSDLAYHKKEWAEEVSRTKSRNQWLKLLRKSL